MSGLDAVSQNVLGLVALIVSLVALITTVLQVLQQYFSSAEGYRRCAASVMGLWSEGTHRQLRVYEFRVEVVFETPVIFMARPTNTRGPVSGQKIHYIDGSEESYAHTRVMKPTAQLHADQQAAGRVHTADDERASWVTLLSTLQREENESRWWDESRRTDLPPPSTTGIRLSAPKPPEYTLAVGVQSKTRSWDFMPVVTRPYATSAICHLVELVAMLGMYWKVFDQILWNLRAEGNGFILTSTAVQGLGVMVAFAATGKSTFKDNRVIPVDEVKVLSFGTVPNIFDNLAYLNQEEDAQSLELVFGSEEDVNATLESLGCSPQTLQRYKNDHKHIFSISFEIIGMLAITLRVRGSSFRMIPNPTSDPWFKKVGRRASWKITRLMEVFQAKLKDLTDAEDFEPTHQIPSIQRHWQIISSLECTDEAKLNIHCREAIHDALDEVTEYLLSHTQAEVLSVLVAHVTEVVDELADPNSPLNTIVLANKEDALLNHYFDKIRPNVILYQKRYDKKTMIMRRNDIWVSLIFRMLCWLLLHDFDKADVNIVPSDLKGSRMPVYIG